MFLNDKEGWYGSFSGAGKSSASKYKVLVQQKKKTSRTQLYNPFNMDDIYQYKSNQIEDNIDIFKVDDPQKAIINKTTNALNKKRSNSTDPQKRYYYHNKNKNKKRIKRAEYKPGCADYNPKYTLILNRTVSGAAWKTITGRKNFIRPDSANSKFYIEKDSILSTKAGKSFVDMSKQTSRPETGQRYPQVPRPYTANVGKLKRVESAKTYYTRYSKGDSKYIINIEKENDVNMTNIDNENEANVDKGTITINSNKYNKIYVIKKEYKRPSTAKPQLIRKNQLQQKESTSFLFKASPIKQEHIPSTPNQSKHQDNNNNIVITTQTEDSFDQFKGNYLKLFKKQSKKAAAIQRAKEQQAKKHLIKAPDFKKLISRDHLNMMDDKKKSVIPFSLPNFKQVRERPLSMVVYDRIHYKNTKAKEFKGIDHTVNYNPDKIIDKVNNHKTIKPPDFNLMTSRPDDTDPLPAYMKQIFNRSSCYEVTALTLKMNNYAEGVFLEPSSEFWPKKTYNKIINLNLLNSKKFVGNLIKNGKKLQKGKDVLAKSMKFYNKNYKDLIKDEMLSRFDNVTYKTNKRHQFLDAKEVERYLLRK